MRTENRSDDEHGVEAALEGDRGLLALAVQNGFEMLDLGLEVVGPRLRQQLLLAALAIADNHRIEAGLVIDAPFDEAVAALDAAKLLRRGGDHVLDHLADQPFGGLQAGEHQPVVIDLALLDEIEQAGDLVNLAGAENLSEMLPDVDAVRMLAGRPAAPCGKAEIAVGRTGEPGMGLEDAAPMLARARRHGSHRPDRAGAQALLCQKRIGGEGMVVTDAGEDAELPGSPEERGTALEVRSAKRLLHEEGARHRGIELGVGKGDMGIRRRADEHDIGLVAEGGSRVLQANGFVPGAVAARIGGGPGALEGGGVDVGERHLPAAADGSMGDVVADRAGTNDLNAEHRPPCSPPYPSPFSRG